MSFEIFIINNSDNKSRISYVILSLVYLSWTFKLSQQILSCYN